MAYSLKVKIVSSIIFYFFLSAVFSLAKSNSKGVNSPLVVGPIIAISADGKTLTILQGGAHKRVLMLSDRTKLSEDQILTKANENGDGGLDYVELSRWVHHSPKHGPDSFLKSDKNDDGLLDRAELTKLLAGVSWWKYSRKSSAEWFRQADANGDGSLDFKEFTIIAAGKNHAENVFKRTDKNKDKALDPKEVANYLDQLIGSTH